MQTRKQFEELEKKTLATYAMKSALSRGRKYQEPLDPYRSHFQRDRDRIIHSTAFRRLEYKTQVFVNHEGDYYRTRLTHTIEVNQIARTIARILKLNEDLTDAISLAHDIGHTPFGHAGEEALQELMKNKGGFDHNSQGLKVVDEFGGRYPEFNGLNLTFETREGIIKHTTTYDRVLIDKVSEFNPKEAPTLEAQVINIADEIAYNSHDLDDGLKANYISLDRLKEVRIWGEIYTKVCKKIHNPRLQVYKTIRELINAQVTDVITYTEEQINHNMIESIDDVRHYGSPLVCFSPAYMKLQLELQQFLYDNLYKHHKVVALHNKAKRFVKDLFNAYIEDMRQLPPYFQEKSAKSNKEKVVCDYIAGMTDRFAQDEYERLFLPYIKM